MNHIKLSPTSQQTADNLLKVPFSLRDLPFVKELRYLVWHKTKYNICGVSQSKLGKVSGVSRPQAHEIVWQLEEMGIVTIESGAHKHQPNRYYLNPLFDHPYILQVLNRIIRRLLWLLKMGGKKKAYKSSRNPSPTLLDLPTKGEAAHSGEPPSIADRVYAYSSMMLALSIKGLKAPYKRFLNLTSQSKQNKQTLKREEGGNVLPDREYTDLRSAHQTNWPYGEIHDPVKARRHEAAKRWDEWRFYQQRKKQQQNT